MTAIKSVVSAVAAHRSFKFGPYATCAASKAQNVIMRFSRECPLITPGSGHVQYWALRDDLLIFQL